MFKVVRQAIAKITGKYNAAALAEREKQSGDNRLWYIVNPHEIYPATIERIQEVLQTGQAPELVDPTSTAPNGVESLYIQEARSIPESAWRWALEDRGNFTDPKTIALRAQALDLARRWYTQALHVQVAGQSMGLHISGDSRYRL